MIDAVLDTNVVVSALLNPTSYPGRVVTAFLDKRFRLLTSPDHLNELRDVLTRPKFDARAGFRSNADGVLAVVRTDAMWVEVAPFSSVMVRDLKDQYLIALAVAGSADYLVSSDKDLLVLADDLRPFGVEVVLPARFVEVLERD